MRNVLDDDAIPDDVNLAVEYQIPLTAKRVDFMLAGRDENGAVLLDVNGARCAIPRDTVSKIRTVFTF